MNIRCHSDVENRPLIGQQWTNHIRAAFNWFSRILTLFQAFWGYFLHTPYFSYQSVSIKVSIDFNLGHKSTNTGWYIYYRVMA